MTTTDGLTVNDHAVADAADCPYPLATIAVRFREATDVESIPPAKLRDPDLWATVPGWMQSWAVEYPVEAGWALEAFASWLDGFLVEAPPVVPASDRFQILKSLDGGAWHVIDLHAPRTAADSAKIVATASNSADARRISQALTLTPGDADSRPGRR